MRKPIRLYQHCFGLNQLSADTAKAHEEHDELRAYVSYVNKKWEEEVVALEELIEGVTEAQVTASYDEAYKDQAKGKSHKFYKMWVVHTSHFVLPVLKTYAKG